ncbi:hypothetical protein [Methylobacterium symbioticum]|uniref:Class I SAM-dependent methyltransferase n=1 Tax=Methylobacterium symbioticum TaxID=2584084 RepID=A0A509EKU8_9HYPH|nr:hypothetical protein [Methylobacterium symbioticum]VUD74996.1 hypothetical protein MET9862_05633 [Methylobacterium symbioticum]
MLLDLALYLVTPAPWRHRRLGYVRESILLTSRARRCRRAWAPHCAAARAAMLAAATDLPRRETVVVLGSGGLADVPLAELSALFRSVVLADAVHPLGARLAARRHGNVRLVTVDLVAEAGAVGALCGSADLTISANLLSQLPIVPLDRYEARHQPVPEGLGRHIVAAHLAALDGLPGRVCLITDVAQREEDRLGRITDSLDLLHGVTLPAPPRAWDWEIAPFGEAEAERRLIHRVHAYPDWAARRPSSPA